MLPDVGKRYAGVYVGIVAFNRDPEHLSRAQVRVYEIHGDETNTTDENLPWAFTASFFGGFYDGGSHTPYPVGASVLVAFEQGDKDKPWILGGVPKRPDSSWKYGQAGESMGRWSPKDSDSDIPKDTREAREETKYITFKTPKGATIVIEERDGQEYLRLVDRAGQVIEMSSPVTVSANTGNEAQRGTKCVETGDQLPYASMVGNRARITVKDLAGQYIRLTALQNGELIELLGCKRGGYDPQKIEIRDESGNEEIRITDRKGQVVVLRSAGSEKKILAQTGSNYVELDGTAGTVKTNATADIQGTAGGNTSESAGGNITKTSGGDFGVNAGGAVTIEGTQVRVLGGIPVSRIGDRCICGDDVGIIVTGSPRVKVA